MKIIIDKTLPNDIWWIYQTKPSFLADEQNWFVLLMKRTINEELDKIVKEVQS